MSSSWEKPSKRRRARGVTASDARDEDWSTRALAIVIAVPVFEVSLYLGLTTVVLSPRLAAFIFIRLPLAFHLAYVALAVGIACRYGMSGLTRLLGHMFGTHFPGERSQRLTVALWAGLALVVLLAYSLAAT